MTELAFSSALELAERIRSGDMTSVELTEMYIDRIERYDGEVNAVVVKTFERARVDARAADQAQAEGRDLGPLHGVPMTIKESYVLEGTPTTWGFEEFRDNVAKADGLAVARFREAGAHFLGKTNVPVSLADFQSYNPVYGTCGNPYDTSRTPGGSSGGSAAALAAGFCGLEAGSDIGGSIRNPAHFCGIYGHKPTYGIVPMQGHELEAGQPETDLAVCGPMARSAGDLHTALDIMAGPAERESAGWQLVLPAADFESLKDLRVAIWATDEQAPVSAETVERGELVAETLRKSGATVSMTARPELNPEAAHINYQLLLNSVMSAGMPDEQVERIAGEVGQLERSDRSDRAMASRGAVLSHRHWIQNNVQRERLRNAWGDFFKAWDILVCPQMATPAFPHDQRRFSERTLAVDNTEQPYFQQLFWAGVITNAYLPSTVFPTGLTNDGLPIGLQAVSAPYQDHRTIEFARQITREIGGFVPPPSYP